MMHVEVPDVGVKIARNIICFLTVYGNNVQHQTVFKISRRRVWKSEGSKIYEKETTITLSLASMPLSTVNLFSGAFLTSN